MIISGTCVSRLPHTVSSTSQEKIVKEKSQELITKKEGLNILFCAASIPILSNGSLFSASTSLLRITSICPSSLFPKGTTEFFDKYIHYPKLLTGGYPHRTSSATMKIWGPCFEELVDRVILQEMLLKRLPQKILQKVSPKHAHLTDHYLAGIARIFISSVFFALHHSWSHSCGNGDMYPYLMAGAIFGTMQEINSHPIYNTIAHVAANSLILGCSAFSSQ